MQIKPFFVVFPVLVGAIIYAYYAPKDKPEGSLTITPKQYIELVEKKKAEKKQAAKKAMEEKKQISSGATNKVKPDK